MNHSLAILLLALAMLLPTQPDAWAADSAIQVTETIIHSDMECFRIATPSATYVYGKRGAGFASIIDPDGHDWISYSPASKALGEYRGLPKCGQPVKFFHCGYGFGQYTNDNWYTSTVTVREPQHARIHSETKRGDSACDWDFYPGHATMTLLRIGQPTYWFLYEGTPGGQLDPAEDFTIRPGGRKAPMTEAWTEVVPWVVFGAKESPFGLFCINHQADSPVDSCVAWPFERDKEGNYQQMTVFGFGRKGYKELIKHIPDLKAFPARFSIGFLKETDPARADAAMNKLLPRLSSPVAPE